jgi:hypothetical protein
MGRVKRHNECGLVVGQLGFHNTAPPRRHPEGPRFENAGLRDDAGWAQSLKISN